MHRPKYDDWSFPKGKLDPGEHLTSCAVREVAEETGLDIRLGPPLTTQTYQTGNGELRDKDVHYWAGWVVGGDDVHDYRPNAEIDAVRWFPLDEARARLTYPHDRETLDEWRAVRKQSHPLIVLRHGKARSRKLWDGDDRKRPLTATGELQADELVPVLAAYGVTRVVSSSSVRCWTTVAPYADLVDVEVEVSEALSEEDATASSVADHVQALLTGREPAVLCTHRPVLPWVFDALGVPASKLDPAGMLVVHHRRGEVLATELH